MKDDKKPLGRKPKYGKATKLLAVRVPEEIHSDLLEVIAFKIKSYVDGKYVFANINKNLSTKSNRQEKRKVNYSIELDGFKSEIAPPLDFNNLKDAYENFGEDVIIELPSDFDESKTYSANITTLSETMKPHPSGYSDAFVADNPRIEKQTEKTRCGCRIENNIRLRGKGCKAFHEPKSETE